MTRCPLNDIPGGAETFEFRAKFCYGIIVTQIVKDRAMRLQHKLESLLSEMERVVYLLKIADPNWRGFSKMRDTVVFIEHRAVSVSFSW